MVQQKPIDLKRLWELAQQGKNAQEIMKELDISEMAALKNAVQNLVDEKGEHVNIPGLIGKGSVEGSYTDTGARIPPGMQKDKG
ncbi:MAG: hypothetical protein WBB23_06645 [Desulforhopalus sp.]